MTTVHFSSLAVSTKKWFRHGDQSIEFGHSFANPIRIASTGPTIITDILQAHRSLCDWVPGLLGKIQRGEIDKPYMDVWPKPRNFKLLPLCRAINAILDELSPEGKRNSDGRFHFDNEMHRQSVVLVLTGDNSGLSTPVAFESLRAYMLPFTRADYAPSNDEVEAIRVPLRPAVRFIADVERREEVALPQAESVTVDSSLCPSTVNNGPRNLNADE